MAVFFRSQINVAVPFDRMSQPVEHLSIAYESGSMPTSSQHRSNSRLSILFPRYSNTLNRALCRSSRVRVGHRQALPLGRTETLRCRAEADLVSGEDTSDDDESPSLCCRREVAPAARGGRFICLPRATA
jgi:hypothetical protein